MEATRRTAGAAAERRAVLLTVHEVARMLSCSARTVYRLTASGRMPRPTRLGALVRWPRQVVEQWVAQGCPGTEREEVSR